MVYCFNIVCGAVCLSVLLRLQMPADMQTVETQKRTMKYEKK